MFLVIFAILFISDPSFAGAPTPIEQCLFALHDTKGLFELPVLEDQLKGGFRVTLKGKTYEMRSGFIRQVTPNERIRDNANASQLSGLLWNIERAKAGNGKLNPAFPTVDLIAVQQKIIDAGMQKLSDNPNSASSLSRIRRACKDLTSVPVITPEERERMHQEARRAAEAAQETVNEIRRLEKRDGAR